MKKNKKIRKSFGDIKNVCIFAMSSTTKPTKRVLGTVNLKIMLLNEFIERTSVKVTESEFEHIHAVYMASDVDKDTFCKMWVKMNKNRVELAKTIAKKREIFMQDLMFVYDICNRSYSQASANAKVDVVFSKKELARLGNLGIEWHSYAFEVIGGAYQLLDKMIEELKKAA